MRVPIGYLPSAVTWSPSPQTPVGKKFPRSLVILHAKSPRTYELPPAVTARAGKQGGVLHTPGYMC